jgi:aspartate aminotransferase
VGLDASLGFGYAIPVVTQLGEQGSEVREAGFGVVEVVVLGHLPILARPTAEPPIRCRARAAPRSAPTVSDPRGCGSCLIRAGATVSCVKLAARIEDLGTESAFSVGVRVSALRDQGRDVIALHIGEPDAPTPVNVVAAAERAIADGYTHYGPPLGLAVFREAIANEVGRRLGVTVDPEHVVVTPGAKPVIAMALLALAGPGDEVIVPDPGFPIYASLVAFVGATPVALPMPPEAGGNVDLGALRDRVSPRTRVLILNSPANPSGQTIAAEDLEAIASLALAHDFVVISDEIYSRLVWDGAHHSMLQVPGMAERTIVVDGLSKTYAMTGWRLGWGIVPAGLVEAFELLIVNTVSCTATFAQLAGVEALTGPQDAVLAMQAEFRARRSLIIDGLSRVPGIQVSMPPGAFYAFPNVAGTGMDGDTFATGLLERGGVSTLAASGFGTVGTDHVRISYANSRAALTEALQRISGFVDAERRG